MKNNPPPESVQVKLNWSDYYNIVDCINRNMELSSDVEKIEELFRLRNGLLAQKPKEWNEDELPF